MDFGVSNSLRIDGSPVKKIFSCFIISIHYYYLDLNKKSFANSNEKQIVIDSFQT